MSLTRATRHEQLARALGAAGFAKSRPDLVIDHLQAAGDTHQAALQDWWTAVTETHDALTEELLPLAPAVRRKLYAIRELTR
mgnify:CR=1 FL=1